MADDFDSSRQEAPPLVPKGVDPREWAKRAFGLSDEQLDALEEQGRTQREREQQVTDEEGDQ